MAQLLLTTSDVIEKLGGNSSVAEITGRGYTAVSNWKSRETFPPDTYLALQTALQAHGCEAPPRLWRMDAPAPAEAS
jgi:hypothetical protein